MKYSRKLFRSSPATASLIIRVGLAAVFAYAAIDAFREPEAWLGFMPAFTSKFVTAKTALDIISILQLGLALWLISGRYIKYAALIAASMLAGIMLFNVSTFLITFRDIGLLAAAVALLFLDE